VALGTGGNPGRSGRRGRNVGEPGATGCGVTGPPSRRFFWPRSYYAPCGKPPNASWGFSDGSQTGRRHLPLFALYRFGLLLFLRSPPRARCSGDPTVTMQEKLSTDAWVCRLEAGSLARFGSRAHLVARDARPSDVTRTYQEYGR
jgi:hypothetical protein